MAIRSYRGGLIVHQMYYKNEIRSFDEIVDSVSKFKFKVTEQKMAQQLIENLSNDHFDAGHYVDRYALRLESSLVGSLGRIVAVLRRRRNVTNQQIEDALGVSYSRRTRRSTRYWVK